MVAAARRRNFLLRAPGPLLLAAALLAVACGGGSSGATPTPAAPVDGDLTVGAFEWGFEPASIVLEQGEEVRLLLDNTGVILHNLKVDDLAAEGIVSESTGPLSAGEGDLFVGAETGQQGTLTFTPLEPGSYVFYCTVSGHRDLGMEGTLTVQ